MMRRFWLQNPLEPVKATSPGPGARLRLTLDAPKATLHYRANLALDVITTSTNDGGEVVLWRCLAALLH